MNVREQAISALFRYLCLNSLNLDEIVPTVEVDIIKFDSKDFTLEEFNNVILEFQESVTLVRGEDEIYTFMDWDNFDGYVTRMKLLKEDYNKTWTVYGRQTA